MISWQENLSDDEIPPVWMWPLEHELDGWFEEVRRLREEKYGNRNGDTTVPMMTNELASGKR